MNPLPRSIYHLVLQDAGRSLFLVADILSESPFPRIEAGDSITVKETQPSVWDVKYASTLVEYNTARTELHITIALVVDSPCERSEITDPSEKIHWPHPTWPISKWGSGNSN